MKFTSTVALLGSVAAPAAAFWRLPCKAPLVVERADPIVNPGKVSGHVHQIMGGNGFDFQMNYNSTQASTCTSCTVQGDFSNYWTPVLYYKHQDGTFEKVDQVGGGLVYYLQRKGDPNEKLHAFPEGFQMIAGDPFKRSGGNDFATQAISYNCLDYSKNPGYPETNEFPKQNCANGIRSQLFFPACWDGKNLDSPDHKSHMSYPVQSYNGGSCPDTHPVHMVSIFFEIIWDTNKFKDMWYGNSQPFVWAQGDPTGYGFHGDFVNGWDVDLLQKAVDQCTNDSGRVEDCPVFKLYADSTAAGCKIASQVSEDIQGPLKALPGCNPVSAGPDRATPATDCTTATDKISAGQSFYQDLTSQGWGYQGCGTDNYYNRAFTGASTSNDGMTNEACVKFCDGKGFSIAGTEYGRECYCASSIPSSAAPVAGVAGNCNMACAGDKTQFCGGAGTISLYQKCTGSSCTNAQIGAAKAAIVAVASSASSSLASTATRATTSQASSTLSTATAKASSTSTASSASTTKTTTPGSTTAIQRSTTTASTGPSTSASKTSSSGSSMASSSVKKPTDLKLPSGWTYSSCVSDKVNPRSLSSLAPYTLNGGPVTSSKCVAYCDSKGFAYAGTEYAGECWCGTSLSGSSKVDESKCSMACTGDSTEMCGGGGTLSLFVKGFGGSNAKRAMDHIHDHHMKRRFARGTAGDF